MALFKKKIITYYYSYDNGNGYTKPASYTTKSTNNFSFAFVGDPQIGSSNELKGKDTKEFYDAQSNAVKSDACYVVPVQKANTPMKKRPKPVPASKR